MSVLRNDSSSSSYEYIVDNGRDYFNMIPRVPTDNHSQQSEAVPRGHAPPEPELILQIFSYLSLYYTPVLVLLGVLGNSLSAFVFLATRIRKHSCAVYCAALAISNTLFVVVLAFIWLVQFDVPVYNLDGWCQFWTLVSCASSNLSSWYTLLLAVDRAITLHRPGLRKRICSPITAKLATALVGAFAISVSVNMSLTVDVLKIGGGGICIPIPALTHTLRILSRIDVFFNAFFIAVMTLVIDIIAIIGLRRAQITRQRSISARDFRPSTTSLTRVDLQLTRTCLIVVTFYVILCLPSNAHRLYSTLHELIFPLATKDRTQIMLHNMLQFVYYTAFVLNPFLYAFSLKAFRNSCKKILSGLTARFRHKRKNQRKGIYALASATIPTASDLNKLRDLSLLWKSHALQRLDLYLLRCNWYNSISPFVIKYLNKIIVKN